LEFWKNFDVCLTKFVNCQIFLNKISHRFLVTTSGLYYTPLTIVNDDAMVINKLEASLTDNARVVIYNRHMFIDYLVGERASLNCTAD